MVSFEIAVTLGGRIDCKSLAGQIPTRNAWAFKSGRSIDCRLLTAQIPTGNAWAFKLGRNEVRGIETRVEVRLVNMKLQILTVQECATRPMLEQVLVKYRSKVRWLGKKSEGMKPASKSDLTWAVYTNVPHSQTFASPSQIFAPNTLTCSYAIKITKVACAAVDRRMCLFELLERGNAQTIWTLRQTPRMRYSAPIRILITFNLENASAIMVACHVMSTPSQPSPS